MCEAKSNRSERTDNPQLQLGDFLFSFSTIDQTPRQKIKKNLDNFGIKYSEANGDKSGYEIILTEIFKVLILEKLKAGRSE